jgi:hypothetical protein
MKRGKTGAGVATPTPTPPPEPAEAEPEPEPEPAGSFCCWRVMNSARFFGAEEDGRGSVREKVRREY